MDQYIGKLLDNRYEILEIIGTGGMARVYKARCHRLNRLVAIKILREDLAQDAEFRRRFHDESQAVAMLSHPNIVAVYDVSRSSELEYIVMELIDGITLKQYMQKKGNKLNWREALHFITQIVKALGHAHSRGIIHRDIKPHNVMVLRDGSVKVADFGIARVASGGHSTLTQEALGSVHYISPEQARGSHIDARSDLYSAGVVLYEMITGRLPFEGDTPVSVAIQHINSIPLSPREIDPSIPEALEAITMKAMAPNPDNRYSSADEMLADLEEFRKNPNINFDYSVSDFMPEDEPDDDKTQIRTPVSASREPRPRTHSQAQRSGRRSRRYEEDEEERSGTSPLMIGGIIAAILVFLVGVVFFMTRVLSSTFAPAALYEVPKVVGENYESAAQDTELLGRFTLVVGETVADEEAEAGTILRQSPEAGSKVSEDVTEITVTISGGPDLIEMIDVYNMEYREAYLKLSGMGLKVATPTYETSDDVAKDHVISYNPPEGAKLSPGDEVQLVVSSGPKEKTTMVPNLETLTEEKAQSDIRLSNLNVGEIERVYDDTVPKGYVVGQYPAAGTEVPEGTTVNLQVSKGPDPDKQPQEMEKTITVNLPDSESPVNVQAMVDGQVIFSETKDPTMDLSVDIPVKGKAGETKTVTIYFDGVQADTREVTF